MSGERLAESLVRTKTASLYDDKIDLRLYENTKQLWVSGERLAESLYEGRRCRHDDEKFQSTKY
jgi:biotin operon repressor